MKPYFLRNRRLATFSLAAALAATGFFGIRLAATGPGGDNPRPTVKVATRSEAASGRGYSSVVKRVLPAVVNISTSKMTRPASMNSMEGMDDPMFRQFFGERFGRGFNAPRQRREKSLGSGVIVSPEGYILTNNHVVDGATDITVTLHDKREMKARLIGADARTDIAVLRIDGAKLPAVTLGDSSKVEVGDVVLAMGNPFGIGQTVTMGIVSAMGRGGLGIEEVEDFIQTDAPINPGNSGGALIDDEGRLVGINTAILSGNSGGNQGIGFAVPINMARHVMNQVVEHGKVERAYLGILPQDVTPAIAKAFNAPDTKGALVGDITADGPASRSELKKGDIIVSINGKPIDTANQLRLMVGEMAPSSNVEMKVLRNGKPLNVTLKLGEFPTRAERAGVDRTNPDSALEGVQVQNVTAEVAQELKLPATTKGVVVEQVSPASRAADAGLRPGDVIQEANHQPVKNVGDFRSAVGAKGKDDSVLLLVNRQGTTLFLTV
ncbi:MAG TPA: DegQ family serine endoprotease [Bryobacteraceae bacterium]|nr:DegQ family serine endoprotease [Bryobacteraceae bacterium]